MRKKALRISVAAALIASMMSVPAYAESAVVTGNGVNMRSGPGTNYRVIDSLPRGATVNVSDRSNGSWYAVDYNGSSGFMSSSYLSITEEDYSGVTTPAVRAMRTSMQCTSASAPAPVRTRRSSASITAASP